MTGIWNGFRGAARRIDDIDIPRIGHRIGVGEDELHAFMDVEAAGSGFDASGRPKMLFEPHIFYRVLGPGPKRDRAVAAGLAYALWRSGGYPKDSYPRLAAAMAIDETAALQAASWGLGQILGTNHAMVGYATPQAMVRAFMADEAAHLDAIVSFLVAAGIDDDLRAHRWAVVARVYNGPAHAKHDYAGRMAAAFARWQRIADTPWSPELVIPASTTMPVLRRGAGVASTLLRAYVEKAQERLAVHGFLSAAGIDGRFGEKTEVAVKAFQLARGLTPDGVIGGFETWPALLADVVETPLPLEVPPPDDPGPDPDPISANPAPTENPAPAGFFVALARLLQAIGQLLARRN